MSVPLDLTELGSSATTQQGIQRTYKSPPLEPGKEYTYTVKARWMMDGKPVEQTREVNVRAGHTSQVNFRDHQAEPVPAPEKRNK